MKKDILLIVNFWHFDYEKKSSRYRTMANVLCDGGYDVEVVSSTFRHQTKQHRDTATVLENKYKYKIICLECGKEYKENHKIMPHVAKAMGAIEKCRTEELGYHEDVCDECGYTKISYNSCRNRHCPKCQSIAREKWIYNREFDLLNVKYFLLPLPFLSLSLLYLLELIFHFLLLTLLYLLQQVLIRQ